jgi:autotransporter passenger strand-loop-strand repeat protein
MSKVYDTVVSGGESFDVSAPVSAYYTTIDSGGAQFVYGGGFANEAYVYGAEYVQSGGSDKFSQVYSGGVEYVSGGGVSRDADI